MKELGRIIAYALLSAASNVVMMWATFKLKEETNNSAKTEKS